MSTTVMKIESVSETCCICGATGDLMTPEEHDAGIVHIQVPLRAMLLHLNSNKVVPEGRLCEGCARRTVESYEFSMTLSSKEVQPLSEKIRLLRRRLHELTQKIDVFIVVGGDGGTGGVAGAYSEDDIIMVDRDALAAATAADDADLERARNARGDNVYQCSLCPMSFERVSEYRAHTSEHTSAGSSSAGGDSTEAHSCWTCGAQFTSHVALREHARDHEPQNLKCCNLCNTTFQSVLELRRHESSCRPICPECGRTCADRAELSAHVAARHELVCAACFHRSATRDLAAAHKLTHRQARQFVCGQQGCILRFPNRASLMTHVRKCHSGTDREEEQQPPPPSTTCGECGRTFATVAALKRHARVHRVRTPSPAPPSPPQEVEVQEVTEEEIPMEMLMGEVSDVDLVGEVEVDGQEVEEIEGEEVEYLEVETLEDGEFQLDGEVEEEIDMEQHYQYDIKSEVTELE